ncbi:centrosomal protein of 70 kDa isoform X4 [Podarcis raffonei]|uniref:centrosomal protein of 70 kDa isoform X4 n=1 Tax=Podarcis raffonei TaxID=65483 RepID=UPI0023290808|nr:centrosomal protein of 70 kDa isoform X4 [Podarcis raffonei]
MAESSQSCSLPTEAASGSMMIHSCPERMSNDSRRMDEQEQEEWGKLNKLLRQHGLKPVYLDKPGTSRNIADRIVMDRQTSQAIRYALRSLMEETERQRKIVRGLIEENRQIRDELRLERSRASRQEQRANELDIIVENVKQKICQLEDKSIAHACEQQNQVKELQKDQQASQDHSAFCDSFVFCLQAKNQQQIDKLREQEETIARLEKELKKMDMEEEERLATQKKIFRQFCKQAPRTHLDQQICSLIDHYESQIKQVRKELRRYNTEPDHTQGEGKNEEEFLKDIDATPNYRALLMSFQTQIIETKARNEQLLRENTNLRKEMEIRPTVQELKFYKHQVKKLEKALKNIKSHEIDEEESMKENRECKSTTGGVLQETCRKYLQVLSSIDAIIRSPRRAPLVTHLQRKGLPQSCPKGDEQECGFEHLPLTVEMWADQLMALKTLHRSLKKLFLQLVPWCMVTVQDNSEYIRVEDLQLMVDEISEEVVNKEKRSCVPSQEALYAMVSHFQKLFDVKSINGIYPRMNEVYTKLGEMINAMRNLCDLLELDTSAPPSVLVNRVGKLCSLLNENVSQQVEQLLGTPDIQSIVDELKEHDNFFQAFKGLIEDLLHILEVRNLTDIVPAVQKLKWKA